MNRRKRINRINVIVFGTGGYASKILTDLIKNGESVVGVCSYPKALSLGFVQSLVQRIRSRVKTWIYNIGLPCRKSFFYKIPFSDLKTPADIASTNHIQILNALDIEQRSFRKSLRKLQPDLVIVCGFPRLIPQDLFKIPRLGMVNLHPSILPEHRGGTPNRWVIRNGDKETGVTAHLVNESFDAGDIIAQRKIAVDNSETWGELENRSSELAVGLVHHVLKIAQNGILTGVPQIQSQASYDPSYKGKQLYVNWRLSSLEIVRTCNAIRPLSGGRVFYNGHELCIWEATRDLESAEIHVPGTIINIGSDGDVTVSCGADAVIIHSFIESGLLIDARKIVKKYNISVGQKFDDIQD